MQNGDIREKLDAFIRKYYLNLLLRGSLIGVALLFAAWFFLNLTEYFGHFSTSMRAVFFWSYMLLLAWVVVRWIVVPVLGMARLGKLISYEKAAVIIGSHFSEVKDKLLNLLQLEQMQQQHPDSILISAGIAQKTKDLHPVPFTRAINLKANKRYLRYIAVPLVLTCVILIFQSSIITEGTQRLLQYNKHFAVKAPFQFHLLNKQRSFKRGESVEMILQITGKSIPEEVYLNLGTQEIKMRRTEDDRFVYTFENLRNHVKFYFAAAGFSSEEYELQVLPVPEVTASEARLVYPLYIGKKPETLPGTSHFVVPEGTRIDWVFHTRDAGEIWIGDDKNRVQGKHSGSGLFTFGKQFFQDQKYRLHLRNGKISSKDTTSFAVSVIPDRAPSISASQQDDSSDIHRFFFLGDAGDDYGISRVTFQYRFVQSNEKSKLGYRPNPVTLPLERANSEASFYYVLHMDALGMAPSDEIEYWFTAWDNDGVHGSKSSSTQPRTLRRKSLEESRKEADVTSGSVQRMMGETFKQASELQKQTQKAQEYLNRQKGLNWENKQRIEDLLEKQKEMFKKVDELKAEQEKLKQQKEEFQKNEEFNEKQKQLDELFKQMEDPELKKLMEEIQKLLEKQSSKDQLKEKLNQMEQMNKSFARDMEKLMEQYKQLQLEQKLNDNIERLEKLAEKEEKLAQKTKDASKQEMPDLQEKQAELQKELQDIRNEIQEAEELNKDLKDPMKLDFAKDENQKADEQMKQAEENMKDNKNGKASENQKSAAEEMKKAAQKMKESLETTKDERMAEDYQKIRELLENLVDASFEQEEIFTELKTLREYNPKFVTLNARQMKVKEKCAIIEDSLRVLAMRQPMVSTFITREISRINQNMAYALEHLKQRQTGEASMREQHVMTGLNNVAVMLLESMDQMQQQMAQKKKSQGSQSCNNPNNSGQGQKKSGQKLSEGQQKLGESLQQLQKQAQQQREGKTGSGGKESRELNKEYAKIALMQEALRRQLQELRNKLEGEGPEGKAMSRELKKTEEMMEQQERQLVNKQITPEMLRRQKEIETRMLEHEKSDRNQKQDEQRESHTPSEFQRELPPQLKEYLREKLHEREQLRRTPPELMPYYRDRSRDYLRGVR